MKSRLPFSTKAQLSALIDQYFNLTEGNLYEDETITDTKPKAAKKDTPARNAQPATLTGLAFHLGFNSRRGFYEYERRGRFAEILQRARLRVESCYEKKLHYQSPTGAMFALRNMGWSDKPDEKGTLIDINDALKIEIIECGPKPASSEAEVIL